MRLRTLVLGLVVGLAAVTAPAVATPASANVTTADLYCVGTEVERCLSYPWLDGGAVGGMAWIEDTGSVNHSVSITRVRIQKYISGSWKTIDHSIDKDYDGWWNVRDPAWTRLVNCLGGYYRVRAHFKWKLAGATSYSAEWRSGPWYYHPC